MMQPQHATSANAPPSHCPGDLARLACVLEVVAPKPGNVHRSADFEDMSLTDMLVSAIAIGPAMAECRRTGVGPAVLSAIGDTRQWVTVNTNLGIVLLLAPLAAVTTAAVADGIDDVLGNLSSDDARDIYAAIRLAHPGGMDPVDRMDIQDDPPADILQAMSEAASRDLIARQYVRSYGDVLQFVVPTLLAAAEALDTIDHAIVAAHVATMAQFPDSLIARKCGVETAREAADRARHVTEAGQFASSEYQRRLADLDFWLRSDGHRRNPGTTADLMAAGLYVALWEERLPLTDLTAAVATRQ